MIKYDRLWITMKERGITQYELYEKYHISHSVLDKLRPNKNVQVKSIDKLCNILHCNVEDIMEHY
jgi:DNA-binding Xre family transcriptional regulator